MKRIFAFTLLAFITIVAFAITVFLYTKNLGKGALQVTSEPNSKVYLDGKLLGQTPLCKCDAQNMVDEGSHTIKLVPIEGSFPPFEQKIPISSKVLTVVDRNFQDNSSSSGSIISLSKLSDKNSLSLTVISFPDKATVSLDGNQVGQSPIALKDITESDHDLKLSKSGYKDKTVRIRTVKGYDLQTIIFLAASPQQASQSASQSATIAPSVTQVLILQTPTGFLRVRDNPSLGGNQITTITPGEKYDFLSEQSGWFEIKLKDGSSGWVSSQYAQKQP